MIVPVHYSYAARGLYFSILHFNLNTELYSIIIPLCRMLILTVSRCYVYDVIMTNYAIFLTHSRNSSEIKLPLFYLR